MKRVLLVLLLIIAVIASVVWFMYFRGGRSHDRGPRPKPLAVSKHSDVFNASVAALLESYYTMTEEFVQWDSAAVSGNAEQVLSDIDSFNVDELKKDSTIYLTVLDPLSNARIATQTIISGPSFAVKREALNTLSDNLRNILVTVRYDRQKLYWQECPMAFGEDKPGNWLSTSVAVRNPYLGDNHPQYKDKMLTCGAPRDTINFTVADTAR